MVGGMARNGAETQLTIIWNGMGPAGANLLYKAAEFASTLQMSVLLRLDPNGPAGPKEFGWRVTLEQVREIVGLSGDEFSKYEREHSEEHQVDLRLDEGQGEFKPSMR